MGTSVGMFYSVSQSGLSQSGLPTGRFSYTYAGDMNGDNTGGNNDLIYVPRNKSEIALQDITNSDASVYTADDQWTDLDRYISQDKYLSKIRGQYAERNGATIPWRGQLDLRILQDFFIKIGTKRNTLQISLDIFNLGNLINSDWGVLKTANRSSLITFKGYDAAGVPQFTYPYLDASTKTPLTKTFRDDLGLTSRWQMQLGIRYIFY
jgi:hypothetical protein